MSHGFPLILLPRRVSYVDDDLDFLKTLRMATPREFAREFFTSSSAAAAKLQAETPHWAAIQDLLSRAPLARSEARGEASLYVKEYFTDWRRFSVTSVFVADYNMPGLNGLELIATLGNHPTQRLLLTGQADMSIGVRGFNTGLIQKFVPKDLPGLAAELASHYAQLHRAASEAVGRRLRLTLDEEQAVLLERRDVQAALDERVQLARWEEYIVVGQPFGLLGMSISGPLQWLQIETDEGFDDLADIMEADGMPPDQVAAARARQAMGAPILAAQLGVREPIAVAAATPLGQASGLHVALFDLPSPRLARDDYGLDDLLTVEQWLRAQLRDIQLAEQLEAKRPGDRGLTAAIRSFQAASHRFPDVARRAQELLALAPLAEATVAQVRAGMATGWR